MLVGVVAIPLIASVAIAVEVWLTLRAPRLPDAPPFALDRSAATTAESVVWLGDSAVAGLGASSPEGALPLQVQQLGGKPQNITVLAVSGARVEDVLHKQLPELSRQPKAPDVIYISVGGNDVTHLTTRNAFAADYATLLDALPQSSRVVMLGVPDMGSPTRIPQPLRTLSGWRGDQLGHVVRTLAFEHHATYVDIAGATRKPFRSDPDRYFSLDGFHPNDEGYAVWAQAVHAASQ